MKTQSWTLNVTVNDTTYVFKQGKAPLLAAFHLDLLLCLENVLPSLPSTFPASSICSFVVCRFLRELSTPMIYFEITRFNFQQFLRYCWIINFSKDSNLYPKIRYCVEFNIHYFIRLPCHMSQSLRKHLMRRLTS